MKVYAIYSPRFNKYYNYLTGDIDDLGSGTKLYCSEINAMRKIKGIRHESSGLFMTELNNDLAWAYLEKKYGIGRYHLDITNKEFLDACNLFKDLKVVPIEISPLP